MIELDPILLSLLSNKETEKHVELTTPTRPVQKKATQFITEIMLNITVNITMTMHACMYLCIN